MVGDIIGYQNPEGKHGAGTWCAECYGTEGSVPEFVLVEHEAGESFLCDECGKVIKATRRPLSTTA